MRYMIYDDEGNALATLRSRIAAEGALRSMAAEDPDRADDLVLMLYDDDGTFTGRALTIDDLPPPVRIAPSMWGARIAYADRSRRLRPRLNDYEALILVGRVQPGPLVRLPEREPAGAPEA